MRQAAKRLLALVLCLAMVLSFLPAASAAETGKFAIAVLTADQHVISPTYITYDQGDTVADALAGSGYEFTGLEMGWVSAIEGVVEGYSLFYDGGAYDLEGPASSVTSMVFTTRADRYSENYLHLVRVMAAYAARTDGIQNYAEAKEAYSRAVLELYNADENSSKTYSDALEQAMAEYDAYLSGEKFTLTLDVSQGTKTNVAVNLELVGEFGNFYSEKNVKSIQVPPGEYEFDLSDGGRNHVKGTVTVEADTTLEAELPSVQWLASADFGLDNGDDWQAVEKADEWTYLVPDYAGRNLYPYLVPGEGVDTTAVRVRLAPDGSNRTWRSHETAITGVLTAESMEPAAFTLEAHQTVGDFVQYQTYPIEVIRVPSLVSLSVSGEGTLLPMVFDPTVTEYDLNAVSGSVDITAAALCDGTTVKGTGNVKLNSGTTAIPVTVSHTNGQSTVYTLNVTKLSSVAVSITCSDPAVDITVVNAAGAVIVPGSDGKFHLIPGEEYDYVATKQGHYHTTASFTASAGLSIQAPAPMVEDWLGSLTIKAASKAEPYSVDSEFDPADHEYVYQVGSNETGFMIYSELSEAGEGNARSAIYWDYRCWDPSRYELKTVAITGSSKTISNFLGASGVGNELTLRIEKVSGSVTYYQDYILTAQRKLQLNTLALTGKGETLVLKQEDGTAGFDKFALDYTTEAGGALEELTVSLKLFNSASGNDNAITLTAQAGGEEVVLDYTQLTVNEEQTFTLPLDPEQEQEELTFTLEREGATTQTYTVTVVKLPPIETAIVTEPGEASVYLHDDLLNLRVLPGENGKYTLDTGKDYTYTVSLYGYITAHGTFTAGEDNKTVDIRLEKAPESTLKDIALDTDFLSFRGNAANNAVTNVPTPIASEEAVLNWAVKVGEGLTGGGVGSPIILGGCLYTYANGTVCKLDKTTGEILATADMDHASSFSITPPAYGEGMLFVGLSDGSIQAFNAETLESLWVFRDVLKGQPNCPITYHDGYVYTGFWNSEVKQANFVCVSVTDEDPTQTHEAKHAAWSYTHNGYYWAGACVEEDYLLVTTDDGSNGYITGHGSVLSIDPRTGILIDELQVSGVGDLRSTVSYDEKTDAYYFTSKGGDFYQVKVNADGTFLAGSLRSLRLSNGSTSKSTPPMSTSTPVIYNGRAYIGVCGTSQFGAYSGHNITVLDLTNWKIAYSVPTQGYPQTSGLLTTAYEEDTEYVYVYFLDNYTPGKLRVIRDRAGQNTFDTAYSTQETYVSGGKEYTMDTGYVLFTPSGSQAQYAICSPIVDGEGSIYFKNDSGYLMCVSSTIEKLVVETEPAKMTYEVGQTFVADGLTVYAEYANGLRKDVTEFIVHSPEPLTVDDTEFTLMFDLGEHMAMYQDKDGQAGVEYHVPTATLDLTVNLDHTWDEGTLVTEATCEEDGELLYHCLTCELTKTEPIPATGQHQWDEGKVTREPGCAQEGEKTFTCGICGGTKTEPIPATGEHSWDEGKVTKEATCVEAGERTYTCTLCQAARTEVIPATGVHTWDEGTITTGATCEEAGIKTFTCAGCGGKRTETVPALGHDWDEGTVTKEPTATEPGERTYTCTACGGKRTEEIPATGEHSWDEGTVTREPTCVEEGEKLYRCSHCDETYTVAIPATGVHGYDEGVVTKEATCLEDGEMTYTCAACGHSYTQSIPTAGAHSYDEGVVTKEPTCTGDGVRTYTCSACGESYTETIPATGSHSYDEGVVTKEATCLEAGIKTFTCTGCGESYTVELPATGEHSWDEGMVTKKPTVAAEGEKTFTCTLCGEKRTEAIARLEKCGGGSSCPSRHLTDRYKESHWAHAGIDYVLANELMNGITTTSFGPTDTLTRGMLVTILWRYAGSPEAQGAEFTDVKQGKYYTKAVAWASANGIVNGLGGGIFAPNQAVTREQIATILFRYAQSCGRDTGARQGFDSFEDGGDVSNFAREALQWAVAEGVLNGSKNGGKLYLNPGSSATRAEAATLFMRYIENIMK